MAVQGTLVEAKIIKRMVMKIHNIIRDSDANSNIITRFEEISKLLFIKLYAEQAGNNIFERSEGESNGLYFDRLLSSYTDALKADSYSYSGQGNTR